MDDKMIGGLTVKQHMDILEICRNVLTELQLCDEHPGTASIPLFQRQVLSVALKYYISESEEMLGNLLALPADHQRQSKPASDSVLRLRIAGSTECPLCGRQ